MSTPAAAPAAVAATSSSPSSTSRASNDRPRPTPQPPSSSIPKPPALTNQKSRPPRRRKNAPKLASEASSDAGMVQTSMAESSSASSSSQSNSLPGASSPSFFDEGNKKQKKFTSERGPKSKSTPKSTPTPSSAPAPAPASISSVIPPTSWADQTTNAKDDDELPTLEFGSLSIDQLDSVPTQDLSNRANNELALKEKDPEAGKLVQERKREKNRQKRKERQERQKGVIVGQGKKNDEGEKENEKVGSTPMQQEQKEIKIKGSAAFVAAISGETVEAKAAPTSVVSETPRTFAPRDRGMDTMARGRGGKRGVAGRGRGRGGREGSFAPPPPTTRSAEEPKTSDVKEVKPARGLASSTSTWAHDGYEKQKRQDDAVASSTSRGLPVVLARGGRGRVGVAMRGARREGTPPVPGAVNPRYAHLPFHPLHRYPMPKSVSPAPAPVRASASSPAPASASTSAPTTSSTSTPPSAAAIALGPAPSSDPTTTAPPPATVTSRPAAVEDRLFGDSRSHRIVRLPGSAPSPAVDANSLAAATAKLPLAEPNPLPQPVEHVAPAASAPVPIAPVAVPQYPYAEIPLRQLPPHLHPPAAPAPAPAPLVGALPSRSAFAQSYAPHAPYYGGHHNGATYYPSPDGFSPLMTPGPTPPPPGSSPFFAPARHSKALDIKHPAQGGNHHHNGSAYGGMYMPPPPPRHHRDGGRDSSPSLSYPAPTFAPAQYGYAFPRRDTSQSPVAAYGYDHYGAPPPAYYDPYVAHAQQQQQQQQQQAMYEQQQQQQAYYHPSNVELVYPGGGQQAQGRGWEGAAGY